MATFFFCGIGGIGMSAIALYLKKVGHTILGSDRSFDQNQNLEMKNRLEQAGIILFPQNGSSVSPYIDTFVVSTAVESNIPDYQRAKQLNLTIKTRAEILASIFNERFGLAVAGTSGKTTTTAMIGHILYHTHLHPLMINGGISENTYQNLPTSNVILDGDTICVIEADESDGSIKQYIPDIAVLTNITLDHKSLDETRSLFADFLIRARKGVVMNMDDAESVALNIDRPNIITFSVSGNSAATLQATNIKQKSNGTFFTINGINAFLSMIGVHNVANALAAIGACLHLGISITESINALSSFKGIQRRMTFTNVVHGVSVFDDYAHNPAKIQASLSALKPISKRIFAIYQPHGFAPLRLTKDDLIATLQNTLDEQIEWIMLPVFYVGGTVQKDISSQDIIIPLQRHGKRAVVLQNRLDVLTYLKKRVCPGDSVVVMGARDPSLSDFAKEIVKTLQEDTP